MPHHFPSPKGRTSRRSGRGFSLVELLIVIAVILVLAGMAIPNMIQSRISANEVSTIGSLRSISRGMEVYRARNIGGDYGYPSDFHLLLGVVPDDLDPIVTTGSRGGYAYSGGGDTASWSISAVPVAYGTSGSRSFYVDSTGVIRAGNHAGAAATVADLPIQ